MLIRLCGMLVWMRWFAENFTLVLCAECANCVHTFVRNYNLQREIIPLCRLCSFAVSSS